MKNKTKKEEPQENVEENEVEEEATEFIQKKYDPTLSSHSSRKNTIRLYPLV